MYIVFSIITLLLLVVPATAQPAPTPQGPTSAPTCEAQLEEARAVNVQLRKAKAQADFTAANLEEAATSIQKRLTELEAKNKAAEKK